MKFQPAVSRVVEQVGDKKLYDNGKYLFTFSTNKNSLMVVYYLKHWGWCIMQYSHGLSGKTKDQSFTDSSTALKEFMKSWHTL